MQRESVGKAASKLARGDQADSTVLKSAREIHRQRKALTAQEE